MARDVSVNVSVDADTRGADKAGDALEKVAREADGADKAVRKASKGFQALDAEIGNTSYSIKSMREEFAKTGDLGLLGDIDKQERSLKKLQRSFAEFGETVEVESKKNKRGGLLDFAIDEAVVKGVKAGAAAIKTAGTEAGKIFSGGLSGALSTPVLGPALIATAVAAAPAVASVLGAAVGAGVMVGVGGGSLAAGIALAAQDSRVQAAWSEVFASGRTALLEASEVFVAPLLRSADKVKTAFYGDVLPVVRDAFATAVPYVDRLTDGVVGLVRSMTGGFQSAVAGAGPFVDMLADELPNIGEAIGEFLDKTANAGPGLLYFFEDFLYIVEDTISVLGTLVDWGSKAYEVFAIIGELAVGNFSTAKEMIQHFGEAGEGAFRKFGEGADQVPPKVKTIADAVQDANTKVGDLQTAFDQLFGEMMGLDEARDAVTKGLLEMADAVKQNGASLDGNTLKGIANRDMIRDRLSEIDRMRTAEIEQTGNVEAANVTYQNNITKLEEAARAAGLNAEQVAQLTEKYRSVPGSAKTVIETPGLGAAQQGMGNLLSQLHAASRTFYANIITRYTVEGKNPGSNPGFAVPQLADGGVIRAANGINSGILPPRNPGHLILAGEPQTKGEVLTPLAGISDGRAMALSQVVGDKYGFDVVPRGARSAGGAGGVVEFRAAPGDDIAEFLFSLMRPVVRGRYGGDVTAAIGGAT